MNKKFFALPDEKRERIINAALKCFAKGGYKHTVTDDIAAQAEISKGLLFHYFENKKGLYEYLFEYSMQFVGERLRDVSALEGDDFFNIIQASTQAKTDIMKSYPYLFDFVTGAYYDESAPLTGCIEQLYAEVIKKSTQLMLRQVDRSKFRNDVDVEMLLSMVFWMADGFMLRRQRAGDIHDLDGISAQFSKAMEEMRRAFYKTEFL